MAPPRLAATLCAVVGGLLSVTNIYIRCTIYTFHGPIAPQILKPERCAIYQIFRLEKIYKLVPIIPLYHRHNMAKKYVKCVYTALKEKCLISLQSSGQEQDFELLHKMIGPVFSEKSSR